VALADLDPQVGLTGWCGRRVRETPLLVALSANGELAELADAGIDELIVDLPPGMPAAVPRLVAQADVVLVPVRASPTSRDGN
jgi:cellulose biosynthesis protein BcsQ